MGYILQSNLSERRQDGLEWVAWDVRNWVMGAGGWVPGRLAGKTQINDTQLWQIARFHVGDVCLKNTLSWLCPVVLCVCVCKRVVDCATQKRALD